MPHLHGEERVGQNREHHIHHCEGACSQYGPFEYFPLGSGRYAKTISKEIISKGITINNVSPGYFKTDRVTQLMKVRAEAEGISMADYEQMAILDFPHKRYMDPQELGSLVCFLCSEQGRSINGTTIQVDGGLLSGLF